MSLAGPLSLHGFCPSQFHADALSKGVQCNPRCACAPRLIKVGLYLGSAAHADDIRSLSQTISATESQAATLVNFTTNNVLQINACKTEVVVLSMTNAPNFTFSVAGHQVGTKQEAKCLGYWWKSNLGSAKSVEANIEKGMKAFFATGAVGAYQGTLNPLSSISLFDTCVVPTVLYGSENWILTEQTIARLETFQSQMGKRYSKSQSTTSTCCPE